MKIEFNQGDFESILKLTSQVPVGEKIKTGRLQIERIDFETFKINVLDGKESKVERNPESILFG